MVTQPPGPYEESTISLATSYSNRMYAGRQCIMTIVAVQEGRCYVALEQPNTLQLLALEEYRDLSNGISNRLLHQDHLFNWSIVTFGALAGVVFGGPSRLAPLIDANMQWILLFVPLLFVAIGLDYQSQFFMVAHLARYRFTRIRPLIISQLDQTLDMTHVLNWETYLASVRTKADVSELFATHFRLAMILLMSILWLAFYFTVTGHIYKTTYRASDWILIGLNCVGIAVLLGSNFPLVRAFRRITVPDMHGESSETLTHVDPTQRDDDCD